MRDSFSITGKSTFINQTEKYEQLPEFWTLCRNDGTIEILHSTGSNTIIGVGDNSNHCRFRYMIGTSSEIKPSANFDTWTVPASTWAVFDPVLSIPKCVGPVWQYIFSDFLPNGDFDLAHTPDLEINQKICNPDAAYTCEIWIPVVKKL